MQSLTNIYQPFFADVGHNMRQRKIASRQSDWHSFAKLGTWCWIQFCLGPSAKMQGPKLHDLLFLVIDLISRGVLVDGWALFFFHSDGLVFFFSFHGSVSKSSTPTNSEKCNVFSLLLESAWVKSTLGAFLPKNGTRGRRSKSLALKRFAPPRQVASQASLHCPPSADFVSGLVIQKVQVVENRHFNRWRGVGGPHNFTDINKRKEGWTSVANSVYTLPSCTSIELATE